jgi:RAB protein geranylgeranyltransferase component A
MDGACSTYGGEESCIQGWGGGNMTKCVYVEDQSVDGRIILHCILNNIYGRAKNGLIWLRIEKNSALL